MVDALSLQEPDNIGSQSLHEALEKVTAVILNSVDSKGKLELVLMVLVLILSYQR